MIGMIALAGIVDRDAIILVDFIHHVRGRGRALFDAIMESRAVRLRPILLTAGAACSGWPITLDPIFSGLAWSLIFGLFARPSSPSSSSRCVLAALWTRQRHPRWD